MSKLYFRYGGGESFTSIKLANQKNGYANPIRELMQNSLTASREVNNEVCKIDIYIEKINKKDIPNIDNYERTLELSIEYLKSKSNNSSDSIIKNIKKELDKDTIDVLMFVDNGKGMNQEILENLLDEISSHADDSAGGSYGVGHLSSFFLSSLRYVLYATKYKENNEIKNLFTGSAILAGHESENATRGSKGRIVMNTPENESKPEFKYPTEFPNFIEGKMQKLKNTGTMVAIIGLNEQWNNDAEYAIASNFFHAISYGGLEVSIHKDNQEIKIDTEKLESLLSLRRDKKQARDAILSGKDSYQAYQTIQESQKHIELSNNDKVYIFNTNNIENSSCICLIRNGMLIARHDNMLSVDLNNLRKNDDFEPFMVVIDVDYNDAKELFKLIRNAENPYHDKLENKKETSGDDKKKIKGLFKELSEKIEELLVKRNRESFTLDMPLLEIPNQAEKQGSTSEKPKSQTIKAKKDSVAPKPPTSKINSTKNGKKRSAPKIDRSLNSGNAMKMTDKGDTINIKLRITPQQINNNEEVYFSISLAQDNDKNISSTALEFIDLSIDSNVIEIEDTIQIESNGVIEEVENDKTQINLGVLSQNKSYIIEGLVKKPDGFNNMNIALQPFLGLKQVKR